MKAGGMPASVLTDDHSEIDTLTGVLLAALEEGDKLKIFAHLDFLWARLAVYISRSNASHTIKF